LLLFFIDCSLVSLLGGLRNSISTSSGDIRINSDKGFKIENTHFKYGLIPLRIIIDSNSIANYHYGGKYFSLLTNFIPRDFYPGKLDTGGITYTKKYTGDQWRGVIKFGYRLCY